MEADKIAISHVAADSQIDRVVALAQAIWPVHYAPIIGPEQVAYMLAGIHSPTAIQAEVRSGDTAYYLLERGGRDRGYFGFRMDADTLFLSKLYVLASVRGQGLGKHALSFIRKRALAAGRATIRLTVNKRNTGAIAAYERLGLRIRGSVFADIGGGFIMDDYEMEWRV